MLDAVDRQPEFEIFETLVFLDFFESLLEGRF